MTCTVTSSSFFMWLKRRNLYKCNLFLPCFNSSHESCVISGRFASNECQQESEFGGQRPLVLTWLNYTVLLCQTACEIQGMRTELSSYRCILRTHQAGFLILSRILPVHSQNFWPVCVCVCLTDRALSMPGLSLSVSHTHTHPMNKNTDRKWTLVWPSPHTDILRLSVLTDGGKKMWRSCAWHVSWKRSVSQHTTCTVCCRN